MYRPTRNCKVSRLSVTGSGRELETQLLEMKHDVRSRAATKMTFRTLFEKQVFIRLTDDHTAFMYTAKWPLRSRTRRLAVNEAGINATPQTMESGSTAQEKAPVLGGIRIE
jgi:hypothetical protein